MRNIKKRIIDHPVAEFFAKTILFGTGAYVAFIAFIVMGAILHII